MERPTFLTILCILTFVASAWWIYSGIQNFTSPEMTSGLAGEMLENFEDQISGQEGAESVSGIFDSISDSMTTEKVKNNGLATIVTNILTLLGAILMWGLKKNGYYVYILGVLAAIISPILIFGGFVGGTSAFVVGFIGVIFIILYGLNLKHMR